MILVLFFVPLLTIISALLMYRFTGRKDFFKFDLVQFFYAFVIAPLLFVWAKTALFVLLRQELGRSISEGDLFVFDTVFSLFFLYVAFFIVIHSLTKTFSLKMDDDPDYDLFEHSEFFHQEISHLIIYAGAMIGFSIFSLANVFVPFMGQVPESTLWVAMLMGVLGGIGGFTGIWLYESKEQFFLRWMKVLIAVFFIIHVVSYFIFDIAFDSTRVMYWLVMCVFTSATFLALFAERKRKKRLPGLLHKLPFSVNLYKSMYYWQFLRKKIATAWQ